MVYPGSSRGPLLLGVFGSGEQGRSRACRQVAARHRNESPAVTFLCSACSTTASTTSSSPRLEGKVVSMPGCALLPELAPVVGWQLRGRPGPLSLQGPSSILMFMMMCDCSVTPLWRRMRLGPSGVGRRGRASSGPEKQHLGLFPSSVACRQGGAAELVREKQAHLPCQPLGAL